MNFYVHVIGCFYLCFVSAYNIMSSDEALVNRDAILACMTCNICNKPYWKATTINECIHTCKFISRLPIDFRGHVSPFNKQYILNFYSIYSSLVWPLFNNLEKFKRPRIYGDRSVIELTKVKKFMKNSSHSSNNKRCILKPMF